MYRLEAVSAVFTGWNTTVFNFLNIFYILYPENKVTEGKDRVKDGFVTEYGENMGRIFGLG